MTKTQIKKSTFRTIREITDDNVLSPQLWAMEALFLFHETKVAGALVHNDFSEEVAKFGSIVHAHRPKTMVANRRTDRQKVKTSKASVNEVDVKLNQWHHQSYLIGDGAESLAFKTLSELHIQPAIESLAQLQDEIILTQVYQFIGESSVTGSLETPIAKTTLTNARRKLLKNLASPKDASFVVGPDGEENILNLSVVTEADKAGDSGAALRSGTVGQLLGFHIYMDQNTPSIDTMSATRTALTAAAAVKGALTIDVDTIAPVGAIAVGSWIRIEGEGRPNRAMGVAGATLTLKYPLSKNIADNTALNIYPSKATAAAFAAEYIDAIETVAFDDEIQKGQMVTFGVDENIYANTTLPLAEDGNVITVNANENVTPDASKHMNLDTPLADAVGNGDLACLGPDGNYNFVFHKNAVAIVSRAPKAPKAGRGVESYVAVGNGLAIRFTIGYDMDYMQERVTVDTFFGVAILDMNLGLAVLSSITED